MSLALPESVATLAAGKKALIIKAEIIDQHFPAPEPGAVSLFKTDTMAVGMVQTNDYPSYPHRNDDDEVHYVLKGSAKFRHGEEKNTAEITAGDVVYVKAGEEHEWFDCTSDFKLVFFQSVQGSEKQ